MDPVWAAAGEAERIHERERRLGEELCPIGEWSYQFIVLAGPGDGSSQKQPRSCSS